MLSFETASPELSFEWGDEESGARLEVDGLRAKDLVFDTPRHPSFEIDLQLPHTPLAFAGHRDFRSKTASPSFAAVTVDSMPRLRSSLDRSSLLTKKVEDKVSHLAGHLLSGEDSDEDDNRLPGIPSRSSVGTDQDKGVSLGEAYHQLRSRNLARGLESIEKELGIGTYGGEAGKKKVYRTSARLLGTKGQVQRTMKTANFRQRSEEMEKKIELYRKDKIEREMLQQRLEQAKLLIEDHDDKNCIKANKTKAVGDYYKIDKQMERLWSRSEDLHSKMALQRAARKEALMTAHESMVEILKTKEERRLHALRILEEARRREFKSHLQKPLMYMFTLGTQLTTWGRVLVRAREFRAEHARQIAAAIVLQKNMRNLTWIRRFNRFCKVKQWLRGKLWRVFMHMRIVKKIAAKNTLLEFLQDMKHMAEALDAIKRYKHKVIILQAQIRNIGVMRKNQYRSLCTQWNLVKDKCRSLQLSSKGDRSPARSSKPRSASVVLGADAAPQFGGVKVHSPPSKLGSRSSTHKDLSPSIRRTGSTQSGARRASLAVPSTNSQAGSTLSSTSNSNKLGALPRTGSNASSTASIKDLSQSSPLPRSAIRSPMRESPVVGSPLPKKRKQKKDGASSLYGINFLLIPDSSSDIAQEIIDAALTKRRRAFAEKLHEWRAARRTWKENAHLYRAELEVHRLLRLEEDEGTTDADPLSENAELTPQPPAAADSDPAHDAEAGVMQQITEAVQQRTASFLQRKGSASTIPAIEPTASAETSVEGPSCFGTGPGSGEHAASIVEPPPLKATLTWDQWRELGDERELHPEYKQLGPPRPVFKLVLREHEEMIPLLGQARK